MHYIGLLDCNNFFVSCERLFRPDLRRKPVVVLSSNDGCVVARSQEIKDNGIPMGVPYFQIKDKLQEIGAVCFSSHFALYRDISRRVFEVVREQVEVVEEYSIDECFFIINDQDIESKLAVIKRAVELQVGIPVSLGAGASKTRAKFANAKAKKTTGVKVMTEALWQVEATAVPLLEIWGVGRGRSAAFTKAGLYTVGDLCRLRPALVGAQFGLEGVRLQSELLGQPVLPVKTVRQLPQSIMSSRSFKDTSTDPFVLKDAVSFHLHQVVEDLQKHNLKAKTLRVFLYPSRHGDYALQGTTQVATLADYTSDLARLLKHALGLVEQGFVGGVPYKKAGVLLSDLRPDNQVSLSLFPETTLSSPVSEFVTTLNQRFGKDTVQLGRVAKRTPTFVVRQELLSPDYTTSFSDLKVVS